MLSRDGVFVGNWIYWTLTKVTASKINALTVLHILQFSTAYI